MSPSAALAIAAPDASLTGSVQPPAQLRELAARCNRLTQLAKQVAQPSEPLDDRWKRGWHELLGEIHGLAQQLTSMRSPT